MRQQRRLQQLHQHCAGNRAQNSDLSSFERRTADHRRHAERLGDRVAERQRAVDRLQGLLAASRRSSTAERRRADAASAELMYAERRADAADLHTAEAVVTVAELEHRVIDLEASLAAWETAGWASAAPLRHQA